VKLAVAGVALLMLAAVATILHVRHREPSFRGRSTSYWKAAWKAALSNDGERQGWAARLAISLGIQDQDLDRDRHDLLFSDDPEAVPVLVELLRDDDLRLRRYIATMVGSMKEAPKAMLPALIVAAHDEDTEVRAGAVQSIGSMGPDAEAAVPDLIQALDDHDRTVRREALYSLRRIGPGARDAIPALMRVLTHDDDYLKGWAAYALGAIDAEARVAVPLIAELLKSKDINVSDPGYNTLAKLDPQALAEAMRWR